MTINIMVNLYEVIAICAMVILVTFIKYRNK